MNIKDMGLGVVSTTFGVWMLLTAFKLKKGPDFWPKIIAISIIVLGFIILFVAIKGYLKDKKNATEVTDKAKAKFQYLNVLAVTACMFIYYFAFQYVGYTIPTFLLIVATSYILGYKNWKIMIPVSLTVTISLYLSFTYLFGIKFLGLFF